MITAKGGAVVAGCKGSGHFLRCEKCTDRDASSQRLCQSDDIRLYAIFLAGQHAPCPPHAALHFIGDHEDAFFIAKLPYALDKFRLRGDYTAFSLDGFH